MNYECTYINKNIITRTTSITNTIVLPIRCFRTSLVLWDQKTIQVPPFAESVTEGDIRWIKQVGDVVKQDEVIGEIETDKTTVPVPAPFSGKIISLLVSDGSKVQAKQDIVVIDTDGQSASPAQEKSTTQENKIDKPTSLDVKIVQVPPFAESVTEGDLKWMKNAGDSVKLDEVVGEIETDKTTVPVPAPCSGKIIELLVTSGTKVHAKQNIFKIQPGDSAPSSSSPVIEIVKAPPQQEKRADSKILSVIKPPKAASDLSLKSSPSGQASGPIGLGIRGEQRVKMSRMRIRIAQRLKESQNTCAMLTTFNEIDMSNLILMRKKYKDAFLKKHGVKLGIMSAFTKASAYALQDQPVVNAVIEGTDIVYRDYVDISIAVATPKGLVVPVLRNCESMNYVDIEKGIFDLGEKARLGKLAIEDMDNGTFTISNGGVFGSLFGTPIINPPQSAILGMHGTFDRPVALNGEIVIRPMMYVALTYDHRLIDGREAVTFLRKIKGFIEDPQIFFLGL